MVETQELRPLLWTMTFDDALQGLELTKEALIDECESVQHLFGMSQLHGLVVEIKTKAFSTKKAKLKLSLNLRADISQVCGVSLDVFRHTAMAQLDVDIMRARDVTDEVSDIGAKELNLVDLNEPDMIEGLDIDIGAYVVEALGLAYDPYARAPGVEFTEGPKEQAPSPFASLEALLPKGRT